MSTPTAEASITTSWPAGFPADRPSIGGFAVREVAAPAESVFAWIRRVDLHPEFYKDLHFAKRISGPWPELDVGSKLSFLVGTLLVPMIPVTKCDPENFSFAWGANLPGLKVCHAFSVQPIDATRSLIRSEELWVGPLHKGLGFTQPIIQKVQTRWAEAIAAAATAHPAGPPAA